MKGNVSIGYIEMLIDNLSKEASLTTGAVLNIYFSKTRKSWVIHYGQTHKVENADLGLALEDAMNFLKQKRTKKTTNKYTMYK